MGRRSVKKDKSIYQKAREELDLTRAEASELLEVISESQLEKIENGKTYVEPEDVMLMADRYKRPDLPNHYCANDCPIGRKYVPEVRLKDLSQIVLEVLASLNTLNDKKDRLIEIAADGKLDENELKDFVTIEEHLSKVSSGFNALELWVANTVATGRLDPSLLDTLK